MNSFQTPNKYNYVQNMQNTVQREGDWICYNCNNLNFSFRKRCNRCKNQTRQQNQNYAYYYPSEFQNQSKTSQHQTDYKQFHRFHDVGFQKQCQSSSSYSSNEGSCAQGSKLIRSYSFDFQNSIQGPIDCCEVNWGQFLNGSMESWDSSCSDSSGQKSQYQELDYQIQLMVTKIII